MSDVGVDHGLGQRERQGQSVVSSCNAGPAGPGDA